MAQPRPHERLDTTLWTIVRHSNEELHRGLEPHAVITHGDMIRVRNAGGLLFEDYNEAEEYVDPGQYRFASSTTLYPQAPGQFSTTSLDGLDIYVPPMTIAIRSFDTATSTIVLDVDTPNGQDVQITIHPSLLYANTLNFEIDGSFVEARPSMRIHQNDHLVLDTKDNPAEIPDNRERDLIDEDN